MYTCGPTVYDYVHIGNFRSFIFQDILRRWIHYRGYRLTHVMNITDVEDKIIDRARQQGVSISDYTRRYEEAFLEDMQTLRIQKPEVMPRATQHIQKMIDLIERLEAKGYTYQSEGSTYYRIGQFEDYGKLSGVELEEESERDRIDSDEYTKESPRDFVLWKARREGEEYWESPMGEGRPGWHIECSAMSMAYLGDTFDIHCGGVDLVFPHHENEIAQSEAATGKKPFVRYWIHGAHLIVEGQKMSKSLGNFYTLRDLLEKGCDPVALRYLLFSVHYRKQLNFTFKGVEQAQSAINRVDDFLLRVREIPDEQPGEDFSKRVARARHDFENALDQDLNTSAALAAIFELVRDGNQKLEEGTLGAAGRVEILEFFADINQVLDVFQVGAEQLRDEEVKELIRQRERAREQKDFAQADEIRDLLADRDILLEDTKEGTRWKRR